MPTVDFEFRVRGAAQVRREIAAVEAAARRSSSNATRLEIADRNNATRAAIAAATREARAREATRRSELQSIARVERERARSTDRAARDAARETAMTERESARRQRIAEREEQAKARAFAASVRAAERAEQQRTRVVERESRRRETAEMRAHSARAREWGKRGQQLASHAYSVAGSLHGQIQDARQRNAQVVRQAGLAFFQAGARSPAEIAARVAQARAFAGQHGMTTEELLAGANAAQTEFSSLAAGTEQERQQRFTNMLEIMRLARNTGNDPGEMARLQGMLAQTGFSPAMQRQMLLYTAGASQAGAVEAGSLTREAMGSVMRRMQDAMTALGANATSEDRQAAAERAFREQVAELQVFRGRGNRVGISGNALASMQEAVRGTNRQDKLLTNIQNARASTTDRARQRQLDQLQERLFEADPSRGPGAQRLRASMQSPLALASTYASIMGNDATGLLNLVAGGGHGNPQSMQANWRNLLSQLVASDTEGVTGFQRVQRLMSSDVALTEDRAREGEQIFGSDALSRLNRENESRDAALTSNTSALVELSNRLAAFAAHDPFAATAASAAAPIAAGVIGGRAGSAAANLLGGAGGSGGGAAGAAGAAGIAGRGAAGNAGLAASALVGLALGDRLNDELMRQDQRMNRNGTVQDTNTFSVFNDGLSALVGELRTLPSTLGTIFSGLGNSQAATQAASVARTQAAASQNRT